MNINSIIISLLIYFTLQLDDESGVYNIILKNLSYLEYYKRKIIICDFLKYPNTYFRINKISNNSNVSFYHIEEIYSKYKYKLSYSENKELIVPKIENIECNLWNFIKLKNNDYIIKNKNNCFVKIKRHTIICENIPFEEATQFYLIKLYNEVKKDIKDNILLENEPIDVLIKYIDLGDPNLKRNGIHQIEKDIDNEELRYSIRSILKNIPWVRKIFILMPNDKVRYFKEYNLIKEKIVYVKDIEFLGYDSSNINAFLFRYWKLKKFGISDNFIVMDDDCFFGNTLEKNDFFYVNNNKVVPAIITSRFLKIDKISSKENYELYKSKATNSREEQDGDAFNYSLYLTYLFIIETFNKSINENIYIPKFTHNAIPVNANELKEIYDLVYNSIYKTATLDSLYREIGYVQFQQFVLSYTFIKYNRKINNVPNNFIRINNTILADYKYSLFCINKGPFNYSYLDFYKARLVMEYLFPIPTPYEIINYSLINISFNIVNSMEKIIKINEINLIFNKKSKIFFRFSLALFLIIFCVLCKIYFNKYYYNNELD
jgi:hypothetical protein